MIDHTQTQQSKEAAVLKADLAKPRKGDGKPGLPVDTRTQAKKFEHSAREHGADKIAADTARYEALAREHGVDLSEEGFNEALKRIGKTSR